METSAIITLLFAIIILVGAIYCKIQGKKQEDWKTNQTVDFIIFCALLFVGFAIRVWQFGMIPDGMNQDGAMAESIGRSWNGSLWNVYAGTFYGMGIWTDECIAVLYDGTFY